MEEIHFYIFKHGWNLVSFSSALVTFDRFRHSGLLFELRSIGGMWQCTVHLQRIPLQLQTESCCCFAQAVWPSRPTDLRKSTAPGNAVRVVCCLLWCDCGRMRGTHCTFLGSLKLFPRCYATSHKGRSRERNGGNITSFYPRVGVHPPRRDIKIDEQTESHG